MRKIVKLVKQHEFSEAYLLLKECKYHYTLDNLDKDFGNVKSEDKYCFLIYLLSKDYNPNNVLLLCEFLMYTDTFFYDVYPVIRMFIEQAFLIFPNNNTLKEWVVSNFKNHPDSPFDNTLFDHWHV